MNSYSELLRARPDLADLVAQGMEAVVMRLVEVERERDEARKSRVPIGNSKTTHAPPSSDPRPKRRSMRHKSGRKTGGQPGHPGHRLEPVDTPDQIISHPVTTCLACQQDLTPAPVVNVVKTQVFDLPKKTPLVAIEHQMESKCCPCCQTITTATAPAGAEQPTQYGPRLAGLAVFLHVGHFIPLERTADIIAVITGHRVSEGWIDTCQQRVSQRLDPFIEAVTKLLLKAKAICCDESGFRFLGQRYWVHVCCTALLTLILCHRKRGAEGISAMGILTTYQGVAVHDHWSSYLSKFKTCNHAFCNEHHVRELQDVTEREHQPWAKAMQQVLYDGLEIKHRFHDHGLDIPEHLIADVTARYEQCVQEGFAANPRPSRPPKAKRGRIKRGKTLCLLDRLHTYQKNTLLFLHKREVPWSNNQAERDIRPTKIQQKVSGGCRSERGAIEFCRIRSYISTMRKHGIDPCEAIGEALAGRPILPSGIGNQQETTKAG